MISVDTKKHEQLGRLPIAAQEWRPRGDRVQVEDHSFFYTGPDVEQAIPYGTYDIIRNTGETILAIHDSVRRPLPKGWAREMPAAGGGYMSAGIRVAGPAIVCAAPDGATAFGYNVVTVLEAPDER